MYIFQMTCSHIPQCLHNCIRLVWMELFGLALAGICRKRRTDQIETSNSRSADGARALIRAQERDSTARVVPQTGGREVLQGGRRNGGVRASARCRSRASALHGDRPHARPQGLPGPPEKLKHHIPQRQRQRRATGRRRPRARGEAGRQARRAADAHDQQDELHGHAQQCEGKRARGSWRQRQSGAGRVVIRRRRRCQCREFLGRAAAPVASEGEVGRPGGGIGR